MILICLLGVGLLKVFEMCLVVQQTSIPVPVNLQAVHLGSGTCACVVGVSVHVCVAATAV